MKILVIDVGGSHVKVQASGRHLRRKLPSGPGMTPHLMVREVKDLISDWQYDVVSIGVPARVLRGQITAEPANLGRGWIRFDFGRAFDRPVKVINDAAMQALGAYKGGRMLFLGLGTGLGSAMIADSVVVPSRAGASPLQERGKLRGLRRPAGPRTQREKEVAPRRRRCRRPPVAGAGRRGSGPRRRQLQVSEDSSQGGPPLRQHRRHQGRISPLDRRRRPRPRRLTRCGPPARARCRPCLYLWRMRNAGERATGVPGGRGRRGRAC